MEEMTNELSKETLETIHEQICDKNVSLTSLSELWVYWCQTQSRNSQHDLIHVCNMGQDIADTVFAKFILALKIPGEREFEIDQITGIMYWLKLYYCKYLSHKSNPKIIGAGFESCNSAYNEKKKTVINNRKHPNHIASEMLADLEIKLWNDKVFVCDAHSIEHFTDVVFFYIVKVFGFLIGSCLSYLKAKHFVFGEDIYGHFVEISREFEREYMRENDGTIGTMEEESNGIMLNVIGEKKFRHYNDPSNPQSFYTVMLNYIKLLKAHDVEYIFVENEYCQETDKELEDENFKTSAMSASQIDKLFSKIMKKAGERFTFCTRHNLRQLVVSKLSICCLRIYKKNGNDIVRHLEIGKVLDPPSNEEIRVVSLANNLELQEDNNNQEYVLSETGITKSTLPSKGKSVNFFFKSNCLQSRNLVHVLPLKEGTSEIIPTGNCCEKFVSLLPDKDKTAYSLMSELQRMEISYQKLVHKNKEKTKESSDVCSSTQPNSKQKITSVSSQQSESIPHNTKRKILSVPLQQSQGAKPNAKRKTMSVTLQQGQSAQTNTKRKIISLQLLQSQGAKPNSIRKIITVPLQQSKVMYGSIKGKSVVLHDAKLKKKCDGNKEIKFFKSQDSEVSQEKYRKYNLESEAERYEKQIEFSHSNTVPNTQRTRDIQMKILENNGGNAPEKAQQSCVLDQTKATNYRSQVVQIIDGNTTPNPQINMDLDEINSESNGSHCERSEDKKIGQNASLIGDQDSYNTLTMEYAISNENGQSQTLSIKDESNDSLLSFPPNFTVGKLKDVSDLDINLGNYLPENILIKPSDIHLKRVVTPDGGKLQISLKYKSCD